MKADTDNKQSISRKKFLQICGSILAGGSILGVSGILLRPNIMSQDEASLAEASLARQDAADAVGKRAVTSPYKLVAAFSVPKSIEAFDVYGDKLVAAASDRLFIYNRVGRLLNDFAIGSNLRDIAVESDCIYLLFPTRVEVYDENGTQIRRWEACSEASDCCSFEVTADAVFVTDAGSSIICKYTTEGQLAAFIQSPNYFVIPSYRFGITHIDGTPVHLPYKSSGKIITSEKGNPRISCYSSNGEFRNILLDSEMLGGGNTAYYVKVQGDLLFVAGKDRISTFRYDKALAAKTGCSTCGVDHCPLRKGINI